ncbi:MAG: hypothetical protein ACF8Q5_06475 [Phycisphaerales bacterium JB040]
MTSHSNQPEFPDESLSLDPASAAAVDALFEHGLAPGADHPPPIGPLLAALGTPLAAEDPALIDLTNLRARRRPAPVRDDLRELSPADQEALEALAREHFEPGRVPRSLRARAEKHLALASVATTPVPGEDATDLVSRTLRRIDQELDARATRFQIETHRRPGGLRLADIVSVAAVVLIASSIVVPVFSAMRFQSTRAGCDANMLATASAMGLYAGSYNGALPAQTAGFGGAGGAGGSWMNVGNPKHSNSANLYTLVTTNHARLDELACPGNRAAPTVRTDPEARDWQDLEEISYSYQIVTGFHPTWKSTPDGRTPVILADRSPVIPRAAAGELINPWENSPNHHRRGQHVLRTDGSSDWNTEAWPTGEDNIWLPRHIEAAIGELRQRHGLIQGNELPEDPTDTFLAP